jgi:L-threonylcarbamoyladenylate synthase
MSEVAAHGQTLASILGYHAEAMVVTDAQLERAVDKLVDGGIVAFPTETVYGVGALASHQEGVERLYELKGRPRNRALIVHVATLEAADAFAAEIPEYALKLARAFWPGPLTMVFRKQDHVLDEVTGGGDTVGVRVPNHPVALRMIESLSKRVGALAGVAAPSANRFGEMPATSAQEVVAKLGAPGTEHGPDIILDGGPCRGGGPSTILSCVGQWPRLLRRGSCTLEEIEKVIGRFIDS